MSSVCILQLVFKMILVWTHAWKPFRHWVSSIANYVTQQTAPDFNQSLRQFIYVVVHVRLVHTLLCDLANSSNQWSSGLNCWEVTGWERLSWVCCAMQLPHGLACQCAGVLAWCDRSVNRDVLDSRKHVLRHQDIMVELAVDNLTYR